MMENSVGSYFDFFGIPVSFFPNEVELKQKYLQNSKQFHPDFHTLASEEKQQDILELSTLNNQAYLVLSNFDKRMKYILELNGAIADEGKNQLDQSFLFDMMEINEAVMELEFDFDPSKMEDLTNKVNAIERDSFLAIEPQLQNFSGNKEDLGTVKDFFLKRRYILRLKENLNKFAPASKEVR